MCLFIWFVKCFCVHSESWWSRWSSTSANSGFLLNDCLANKFMQFEKHNMCLWEHFRPAGENRKWLCRRETLGQSCRLKVRTCFPPFSLEQTLKLSVSVNKAESSALHHLLPTKIGNLVAGRYNPNTVFCMKVQVITEVNWYWIMLCFFKAFTIKQREASVSKTMCSPC